MYDDSLMMVPNRLAIEGEELVAHRFQSGSLELVSCFDYENWLCIPPGARLRLDGLPEIFKDQFHLSSWEEATVTQLSAEANEHRDALCFDNSAIVSLDLLPEGQKVKVLRLSSQEEVEPDLERFQVMHTG